MTKFRDTLLAGAALILGSAVTAGAADLNRGSLKDTYMPAIAESPSMGRAIYLRLDGGIAAYDRPFMVLNESSGFTQDLTDTRIDRQWAFGGGIGGYFGKYARADLTVERRYKTDVSGDFRVDNGCGFTCSARGTNSLQSTLLMANFYYDFNRDSHFTPYVGVGIGGVRHEVGAGKFSTADGSVAGTIDGASNWSMAGSLMAGADIKLHDRLHLDAGYRFLYLGHTATGATKVTVSTLPYVIAQDPAVEQIHAHEFRLGLRYDIK